MQPQIHCRPDFGRFLDTLLLRRAWRRPPLFDFAIHPMHRRAILGKDPQTADDIIEFYRRTGYDYVFVSANTPHSELEEARAQGQQKSGSASHGSELTCITGLEQFQRRRWSWQDAAEGDLAGLTPLFDRVQQVAAALPPSMRIILATGDVFTYAWEMIGFENLCLAAYEEPQFVQAVIDSLSRAACNILERAVQVGGDRVGAVIYTDDIAYTEGLMLAPDFFRARLFPTIRRLADIARRGHAPLIYHSDGKLFDVFDDLASCGVRAIQPLEPKSMDPLEIKRRWPGRFCLMGNIDLDLMARGTADEVERHVRYKIDRLNADGGYMPGVSNTVPDYVSTANYLRMIETVYSYPDEPISGKPAGQAAGTV